MSIKDILPLYIILDRFHRDNLYKLIGVELEFSAYANYFEEYLKSFDAETLAKLSALELGFEDYAPHLEEDSDVHVNGILDKHNKWKEGVKFSLLAFACSQSIPSDQTERECLLKIILCLIRLCPLMIKKPIKSPGKDQRNGPTPLHVMIIKEANTKSEKKFKHQIIRKMIANLVKIPQKEKTISLSNFNLRGEWSTGLFFRGKTVLNIAARTLDMKIIRSLLTPIRKKNSRDSSPMEMSQAPVCFDSYNDFKDNIYHSLVRYTFFCPEKEKEVIETMKQIEELLITNSVRAIDQSKEERPESLWLMRNRENLTPLQLAAKLGRIELFKFIINRKVYRLNSGDMGTFDNDSYNVTEIDTLPIEYPIEKQNKTAEKERAKEKKDSHVSIIHLLEKNCPDETSARFVNQKVMMKVIAEKWRHYRGWFIVWSILHFLMMLLFSWQAVFRSRLENPIPSQTETIPEYDNVSFVIASSCFVLIYGILSIVMQILYFFSYCYKYRKSVPIYAYCHAFFVFGLSIVFDFILMFSVPTYENFILPFVLILGWYLSVYFLHVIARFSFFTVLIKQVVRHLVDFGAILAALLLGFSIAMFVVMQNADDIEEDTFENLEKTIVKMFTIMLGIGELGVLFNARHPVLAIIIFALFVLLTTILLLNALIAIMSNTCSELTGGVTKKAYVRLQRMYTIIDIEAMLPQRLLRGSGEEVIRISPISHEQTIKMRVLSLNPDEEEIIEDGQIEENILNQISHALFGRSKKTKIKTHAKSQTSEGTIAPFTREEHIDITEHEIRQ